ncbi:MAG: hypothetical protein ABGZ53_30855, partial [Fuerstiella sp.]
MSASTSLIGTDTLECLTEADHGHHASHDSDQHAETTAAGVCASEIIAHAHEPAPIVHSLGVSRLPELPGLILVDPSTDVTGQIIYLNFDGAEDVTYNGPVTVGPFDVPAFEGPGKLAGQEELIIASVVRQLEETFADSGVIFTTEQPVAGVEYSTIYIGGDDSAFGEYGEFFGLSETVDIGHLNKTDEGFVLSSEFGPFGLPVTSTNSLAQTIEHEVGHLFGFQHHRDWNYLETNPLSAVAHGQHVHTYIANEAFDFYASQFEGADLNKAIFAQGDFNEDESYLNPWDHQRPYFHHLWDHYSDIVGGQFRRDFNDGWGPYDSAANRAVKYFTGGYGADGEPDNGWSENGPPLGRGIIWMYQNGHKTQAFDWLGHAAHLLQDLTVPAHSHADGHGTGVVGHDSYEEEYIGVDNNWTQWGYPASQGRGGPTGDIGVPADLFDFLTAVVGKTEEFDSDGVDGRVDQGDKRHKHSGSFDFHIDDDDCQDIGDTLMPLAMKATSELIRYFYAEVDTSAPVVTFDQFSSDVNNPTYVNTSNVDVSGSANDPQSGIDTDGFEYGTNVWTDSGWSDTTFHGRGSSSQTLGPFSDGHYVIRLFAENGGGRGQASENGFFSVDTIAPGNVGSFTATPGDGQVSLSWTEPSDSDYAGVKIQRKTGGYPTSHTDGTNVYEKSGTSHVDTNRTNGTTYYYKAFSYDNVSNYASGATDNAKPSLPTLTVSITADSISEIAGTAATTASVTRSDTDGAIRVTLQSSDPGEAIPATSFVNFGHGQASRTFNINAVDDAFLDGTQNATITASASGYDSGSDTVNVTDYETLTAVIAADSISENAGHGATTVTVIRSNTGDLSQSLSITLGSNDTSEARIDSTAVIAANQSSGTFDINAADDAFLDGTQTATITATASGYESGSDSVDVTDYETLTVVISHDEISEAGATIAKVRRSNSDNSAALTLNILSDDTGEATVAATVEIAAGEYNSTTFAIFGVDDATLDGTQTVTISANAPGYVSVTDALKVTEAMPGRASVVADLTMVASNWDFDNPLFPSDDRCFLCYPYKELNGGHGTVLALTGLDAAYSVISSPSDLTIAFGGISA